MLPHFVQQLRLYPYNKHAYEARFLLTRIFIYLLLLLFFLGGGGGVQKVHALIKNRASLAYLLLKAELNNFNIT